MAKSYVISVSYQKDCYRHIQISESATLQQLHQAISAAFGLQQDPSHAFFMDKHLYTSPQTFDSETFRHSSQSTADFVLEDASLRKDTSFKYIFDLESPRVFQCKILQESAKEVSGSSVLRTVGQLTDEYVEKTLPLPTVYEPEQLAALYRELSLPEKTIRSVHNYFEAASHLYGIIPLKHLWAIYNRQNPMISQEDFLAIADIISHEANDFAILDMTTLYAEASAASSLDREVISLVIFAFGPERYYELSDLQAGKAYPILPKERFLAYLDPCFCPDTPQNLNMLTFLKNRVSPSQQSAENLLSTIQTMIWIGCRLHDVIQGLSTMGVCFQNDTERRQFSILFSDMARHTRKIENRGQTPAAMRKQRRSFPRTHRRVFSRL